jgi:hypothetical protein
MGLGLEHRAIRAASGAKDHPLVTSLYQAGSPYWDEDEERELFASSLFHGLLRGIVWKVQDKPNPADPRAGLPQMGHTRSEAAIREREGSAEFDGASGRRLAVHMDLFRWLEAGFRRDEELCRHDPQGSRLPETARPYDKGTSRPLLTGGTRPT